MTGGELGAPDSERRRDDRRGDFVRLADYTIPEVRKAFLTGVLLMGILALFLYMIHQVMVALIAGVVLAVYLLPFHRWTERRLGNGTMTAILVIVTVIVPLVVITAYSWFEIAAAAEFLNENRENVAAEITEAIQRLPFSAEVEVRDDLSRWVTNAADQSASLVDEVQETLDIIVLSIAVFLFTLFYILTDHERIIEYIRSKVPGRYRPLGKRVSDSIRRVAYGALYATFLTQILKALIILAMNLVWDVPLAVVLAIASFFIGFLPIVGSWSVYVPVAIYLMVFRDSLPGGIIMLLVGFFVNTVLISLYLRPRIAAAKAGMLNFYWMFLALITGVYSFGLVGIIIGPILIGVLKAVFESVVQPVALADLADGFEPFDRGTSSAAGSTAAPRRAP